MADSIKLKWKRDGHKSDYARVKGLGSAHEGVEHWIWQRITAIGNLFLVSWAIYGILTNLGAEYDAFRMWISTPLNTTLMILFIVSTFWHAFMGVQVIVEDYIHHEPFKIFKLWGMKLVFIAMAVASIVSILKISLGV